MLGATLVFYVLSKVRVNLFHDAQKRCLKNPATFPPFWVYGKEIPIDFF